MFEENKFHPAFAELSNGTSLSVAVVAIGLLAAGLISLHLSMSRRRAARAPRRPPRDPSAIERFDRSKMNRPEHQMKVVAAAEFETQRMLNASEAKLLPVIEGALARYGRGHRVMAQTSLGELLRPRPQRGRKDLTEAAHAAINSKRLDFAIIDRSGRLVAAIEYQGSGHYGQTAFMRDAVKREVCRKAGVAFLEVKKGMRPSELDHMLNTLLAPDASVAAAE
jgi:hypothetical protein